MGTIGMGTAGVCEREAAARRSINSKKYTLNYRALSMINAARPYDRYRFTYCTRTARNGKRRRTRERAAMFGRRRAAGLSRCRRIVELHSVYYIVHIV